MTTRPPRTHIIKVWPSFWDDLWTGAKTFELRLNDRDYQVDDLLVCVYFDPDAQTDLPADLTQAAAERHVLLLRIVYLTDFPPALREGFVGLGIEYATEDDVTGALLRALSTLAATPPPAACPETEPRLADLLPPRRTTVLGLKNILAALPADHHNVEIEGHPDCGVAVDIRPDVRGCLVVLTPGSRVQWRTDGGVSTQHPDPTDGEAS